jgi:hypothetical protein
LTCFLSRRFVDILSRKRQIRENGHVIGRQINRKLSKSIAPDKEPAGQGSVAH